MSETNLEAIKEMIKNLSPEERHEILPFLAEFPDSGIHAFDLKKEFEFLKNHGLRTQRPDDEPDRYLIDPSSG